MPDPGRVSPAQPLRPAEVDERRGAIRVSLGAAVLLAGVKLATALATGSLAVLASFLDSVMDVFASTVNAVAITIAGRPADADHAYGHGKAESLAGLFQGVVIGCSGLALLAESARRLWTAPTVAHAEWGIAVMAFSIGVTAVVVMRLRRALRVTDSLVLRAEWTHYASDFAVNGAALAALVLERASGLRWADPVASAAIAAYLVRAAWRIFREAIDVLMDRDLPTTDVVGTITHALEPLPEVLGFHGLRTRRSGTLRFIDLHLDLDRELTFARAHALAERAILAIEAALPGATVWVHADPYPPDPGELDAEPADRRLIRQPAPTPQGA